MRSEEEFIRAIDCKFPHDSPAEASALIREGCAISSEAAFMLVHMIVGRARDSRVSDARRLALLDEFAARFDHPLKELVLRFARAFVRRAPVPIEDRVAAMRTVGKGPVTLNALNVLHVAATDASDELDEVDDAYDYVMAGWGLATR